METGILTKTALHTSEKNPAITVFPDIFGFFCAIIALPNYNFPKPEHEIKT